MFSQNRRQFYIQRSLHARDDGGLSFCGDHALSESRILVGSNPTPGSKTNRKSGLSYKDGSGNR